MIRVTAGAIEQLSYAGAFYEENTVNLRLMLEMLRAGATSINTISCLNDVMALLDCPSITQDQFDDARVWLCLPHHNVPARTFTQIMMVLCRKVSK
jgi:hypothetical protein